MASFQIHEDQENRVLDINEKPTNMMVQQKRAVFGVLDNKTEHAGNNKPNILKNKKSNENEVFKKANKAPAPIVPVAQFEAFKVYEDSDDKINKELLERQRKRKDKDNFSNVYKGTNEDRFVTKKEVKSKLQQDPKLCELLNINQDIPPADSPLTEIDKFTAAPMSIEKSLCDNVIVSDIAKSRTNKDVFFEMEEYRNDIFAYLLEREKNRRPKPGYMKKQPDITYNMRTILVDWLVEVAEEYKLHTETLYLAVNYIDRFLSYMSVVRAKLQLVGTAAMYIASKYEEIYPPDVGEFVYITDDTYDKHQVTRMEMLIVKILDFDLSIPTPYTFITAVCIANKMQEKVMYLAMYLSELSLLEAEPCLETLPSIIACSAICLARFTLNEEAWTEQLSQFTGYEIQKLYRTIEYLYDIFVKAPVLPQQAIQDKYKNGKFLHISTLKPKDISLIVIN